MGSICGGVRTGVRIVCERFDIQASAEVIDFHAGFSLSVLLNTNKLLPERPNPQLSISQWQMRALRSRDIDQVSPCRGAERGSDGLTALQVWRDTRIPFLRSVRIYNDGARFHRFRTLPAARYSEYNGGDNRAWVQNIYPGVIFRRRDVRHCLRRWSALVDICAKFRAIQERGDGIRRREDGDSLRTVPRPDNRDLHVPFSGSIRDNVGGILLYHKTGEESHSIRDADGGVFYPPHLSAGLGVRDVVLISVLSP